MTVKKKPTTRKGSATKKAFRQQAAAVAEFIKNAPPIIRDGLESFLETADNSFQITTIRNGKGGIQVDRAGLAEFLELAETHDIGHFAGGYFNNKTLDPTGDNHADEPKRLIKYAPEIEARRADYKRLAESFALMIELESKRSSGVLDIAAPGVMSEEPNSSILIGGVRDHFDALFQNIHAALIYEEEFLNIIYPELRLWYDHQMLAHRMGEFSYLRAGETLTHRHTPNAELKVNTDTYKPLGILAGDTLRYCLECQPEEGQIAIAISTKDNDPKFYFGRVRTTAEGVELVTGGENGFVWKLPEVGAKILGRVFEATNAKGGTAILY